MAAAVDELRAAPAPAPFGTVFADRMAIARYRDGDWSAHEVTALEPLSLHPGAHVLHYASACFEGLKAFRTDRGVRLFRLDRHVARLVASAGLLCLPAPDPELVERMIVDLVRACEADVPDAPGALYLRPTLVGTEVNIGAAGSAPKELAFYVLASPVGDYFAGGMTPLTIFVEEREERTTAGFGMAKAGANYASALRHVEHARERHGAHTVLFCPGGDVQETGASNFLLLDDETVITKPLGTSFLHGVTRDSVLALARDLGYRVEERDIRVDELREWAARGEAALSGTAAVLAGVGTLVIGDEHLRVGDGSVGPNTRRLRDALTAIQCGRAEDRHGWLRGI